MLSDYLNYLEKMVLEYIDKEEEERAYTCLAYITWVRIIGRKILYVR
jgi:hypothetical protein